jgi:hypothetical protein
LVTSTRVNVVVAVRVVPPSEDVAVTVYPVRPLVFTDADHDTVAEVCDTNSCTSVGLTGPDIDFLY